MTFLTNKYSKKQPLSIISKQSKEDRTKISLENRHLDCKLKKLYKQRKKG